MSDIDIYGLKKRMERTWEILDETLISEKNKDLIKEFIIDQSATKVGIQRRMKLITSLKQICLYLKIDLDQITETKIKLFDHDIELRYSSANTRSDYRKILKQFLRWSNKQGYTKVEYSFLYSRVKRKDKVTIKKSDLIIEEDMQIILQACNNPRDRAMMALAWDTGARIGELGTLRVKDVSFENKGTIVDFTKSKTNPRSPWLLYSTEHIMAWLRVHPFRNDPDAPLWPVLQVKGSDHKYEVNRRPLQYRGFYFVFRRIFERANIPKPFNPHMFRHARATWAAQNGWNNQLANKYFGWTQGSDMYDQYVTLVGEDVSNKMKSCYGMKNSMDERRNKAQVVDCPRCETANVPDNKFCYKCGLVLCEEIKHKMNNIKEDERKIHEELLSRDLSKYKDIAGSVQELLLEAIKNDPDMIRRLAGLLK